MKSDRTLAVKIGLVGDEKAKSSLCTKLNEKTLESKNPTFPPPPVKLKCNLNGTLPENEILILTILIYTGSKNTPSDEITYWKMQAQGGNIPFLFVCTDESEQVVDTAKKFKMDPKDIIIINVKEKTLERLEERIYEVVKETEARAEKISSAFQRIMRLDLSWRLEFYREDVNELYKNLRNFISTYINKHPDDNDTKSVISKKRQIFITMQNLLSPKNNEEMDILDKYSHLEELHRYLLSQSNDQNDPLSVHRNPNRNKEGMELSFSGFIALIAAAMEAIRSRIKYGVWDFWKPESAKIRDGALKEIETLFPNMKEEQKPTI